MSKEEVKEAPDGTLEQGDFKIKKKPKKLANKKKETPVKIDLSKKPEVKEPTIAKLDLTKKEENADKESSTVEVSSSEPTGGIQEIKDTGAEVQQVKEESKEEITQSPIIEVVNEKETENTATVQEERSTKEHEEERQPKNALPENVEKLVTFMQETGGSVEDYVRLSKDYSSVDDEALLKEYYKNTKPHLNQDEIDFIMEDNFSYDEDMDEERDIRKKKLAHKEEIAKAKNFLEETKKKYYDEIKLRPGATQEQQKAMEFFNRYNKEQEMVQQQHNQFKQSTKTFFNDEFKGFDFNVGEKRFRYNVNNIGEVAENQSNLTNFVGRFLDEKGNVTDYKGYHKAIYAAKNADTIANHFYEQGKADATKNIIAKSKNINNEPRATASGDVFINGLKVKAINGIDSSKLKIKKRK